MSLLRSMAVGVVLSVLGIGSAQATIINTSLGQYDVTTVSGSFIDNSALLQSQAWWDDLTLTNEFAELIGDEFGLPNNSGTYPAYFAYAIQTYDSGSDGARFRFQLDSFGSSAVGSLLSVDLATWSGDPVVWAVASRTSVPEPASIALMGLGLVGLGFARKKKTA